MSFQSHIQVQASLEKRSFLIILAIFLFFSISGVLAQVFLPDILELSGLQIEGLPEPSMIAVFIDVWADFLLTGGIIIIYYGATTFSSDMGVRKTIYYNMSRPISRTNYFLTRVGLKNLSLILISLISSFVVFIMGLFFFDTIEIMRVISGAIILALGMTALMSVMLMVNTKLSTSGSLGFGIAFLIFLGILGIFIGFIEELKWASPFALSGIWSEILAEGDYSNYLSHTIGLLAWSIIPSIIGNYWFNKRDL